MPYDEKVAERVRRALALRRDVVERKMMGGLCFMVAGSMCCGVTRADLMVRVGRAAYEGMLVRPNVRPLEFGGRRPTGFILIEPAGYRTDTQLVKWIELAIDVFSTPPANQRAGKAHSALAR